MKKVTPAYLSKSILLIPSILLLLAFSVQWAKTGANSNDTSCLKVGIYDSRAVAIAYFRSEIFTKEIQGLQIELKEAKEKGDESKVEELNAKGQAFQTQAHQQGFGNAPINDIIKRFAKELPQIANKAGVDLIVSKWNLDYQTANASFVNVTDLMVEPFSPSKETLKVIKDIQKKDPVPLEVLKEHKH